MRRSGVLCCRRIRPGCTAGLPSREGPAMSRARVHPVRFVAFIGALLLGLAVAAPTPMATGRGSVESSASVAAADTRPNIFFYNLDDLRDAFPGAIDPLRFMPKTRAWMADGRR